MHSPPSPTTFPHPSLSSITVTYPPVQSDKVARADKTAPMPELEKGAALEGLGGSGGGSSNPTNPTGQGKGAQDSNKPPIVDQVTK